MAARKKGRAKSTEKVVDIGVQSKEAPLGVEVGYTGTDVFSGNFEVDYRQEWRNLSTRIPLIQQMMLSDTTVTAILEAVKAPLMSAKYYVEPASQEQEDLDIAEFVRRALFEELQSGYRFADFLEEALTYLEYGFMVFEKIYKRGADGYIYWDRFAPRIQSSIHSWTINNQPWVNGYPVGISQIVNGTDEIRGEGKSSSSHLVEIPWKKLVLFTRKQKGSNFEGESILSSSYLPWYAKQVLYKVASISAERFGVGIPYIKHKKTGAPKIEKYKELVKNIRSNEQAYAVFDEDVVEFDILTPKGNGSGQHILDLIRTHDRKIYDSVLAGFLNLTSGEGGSNALSSDHSAFFLRGLQRIAAKFCSVMDSHIQELVYINFPNAAKYPCLKVSDISEVSLVDYVSAMSMAKEKGLTPWLEKDIDKAREQLHLSPLTEDEKEELGEEKEKMASLLQPKAGSESKSSEEEIDEEDSPEELSEEINKLLAEEEQVRAPKRENVFVKNISDFENFLESSFADINTVVSGLEENYRYWAKKIYESADKERIDGVLRFARTPKNKKLEKKVLSGVNLVTEKIREKLIESPLQRRLFATTRRKALEALVEDEKQLAEIEIDEAKFESFIRGYASNVEGVLFNEPRRIAENIVLNFGSQVSVDLAVQQADGIEFNRNILKLSTITHARAAYNAIQFDANVQRGFTHFKVLVPKKTVKTLNPTGKTAELLFGIFTAAELNKRIHEATDGKNTDAIAGLGIHHGSFTYYYPVSSEQLAEERALSKQQRAKLREQLENNDENEQE